MISVRSVALAMSAILSIASPAKAEPQESDRAEVALSMIEESDAGWKISIDITTDVTHQRRREADGLGV